MIGAAAAAARPHYGGTLRLDFRAAPASLDPMDLSQSGWPAGQTIAELLFDTLVVLDNQGKPQPSLAVSWQAEPGNLRWHLDLRRGVTLPDGTALTADVVAASLRAANPNWTVVAAPGSVAIECESPTPRLPFELALSRNAIARREGKLLGTGPFVVTQWDPGKKLVLTARDDYWQGRVFVDSIEIELGRNLREQKLALDLGRADVVEVAPEQAARAATEGRQVQRSAPFELMALIFTHERQSAEEGRLREALALSIDRNLLNNVLLQGGGEPAAGLLPNWMTGYGFLFPTDVNLQRAQQAISEVKQVPVWTLGYDASDPVARVVAERIALNARDAGLTLQITSSGNPDLRLVRVPLLSLDARTALQHLARNLGFASPGTVGDSIEDLYSAEAALLQTQRVIPLLHLRSGSIIAASVRNWDQSADGSWRIENVWLSATRP